MIRVDTNISGRKAVIAAPALVDTGFTAGLLCSKSLAKRLGAILVRPNRFPHTIEGKAVRGESTILLVSIPEAQVEVETPVFCPDVKPNELLLGAYFLAQVGCSIRIGVAGFKFLKPNPSDIDLHDMSRFIVPADRPASW